MPKEGVHLWLVEELWTAIPPELIPATSERKARLLLWGGAIFPDAAFYSPFPSHELGGASLHRFEGMAFADYARASLWSRASGEEKLFLCGMMIHLLADGHWHPSINAVAAAMAREGGGLSTTFFHRMVESYMQATFLSETHVSRYLRWIEREYTEVIPLASAIMERYGMGAGNTLGTFSRVDWSVCVHAHRASLRALHSYVFRSRRRWFLHHRLFQCFSSLIPPTKRETALFLACLDPDARDAIFSRASVERYLTSVTNLFRALREWL